MIDTIISQLGPTVHLVHVYLGTVLGASETIGLVMRKKYSPRWRGSFKSLQASSPVSPSPFAYQHPGTDGHWSVNASVLLHKAILLP